MFPFWVMKIMCVSICGICQRLVPERDKGGQHVMSNNEMVVEKSDNLLIESKW